MSSAANGIQIRANRLFGLWMSMGLWVEVSGPVHEAFFGQSASNPTEAHHASKWLASPTKR
jgi:hypothetical protein